jgi:hypothetical protein
MTTKTRMGRPVGSGQYKQTVPTSLRLEPETRQLLNVLAMRRNQTQAEVVDAALRELAIHTVNIAGGSDQP